MQVEVALRAAAETVVADGSPRLLFTHNNIYSLAALYNARRTLQCYRLAWGGGNRGGAGGVGSVS